MRNFFVVAIVLALIPYFAFTQNNKTILSIDDKNFSLKEFKYVYNKNNGNTTTIDKKSIEEYLDLYINFRLKVKEAEDRGMDTSAVFKRELAGYRSQLAKPYLTDKSIDEEILKEAYNRLKWDIRASHIMITVPQDFSDNDPVAKAAYKKLVDIRKKIIAGADFAEMAKKHSDDPSARDMPETRNRPASKGNGGDLGYFTAFYMVYPFETAAFTTAIGEISMPIRTQYGYHIIKVYDKIPELGKIEVKHINVKPKSQDELGNNAAKAKIEEIATEINSGKKTFEEAAKQYSDDRGSAEKGGLLPAFEVSRMVPSFIKAISPLKPGGISKPIKTEYGWHLIKLVRTIPTPSYEDYYSTLKSKVSRDSRSNRSKEAAIEKFKKEFKFKEYSKNLTKFYAAIDSSVYENKWTTSKANGYNKTLFKLDGKKFQQSDFAIYVEKHQNINNKGTLRFFTDKLYKKWVEESVLDYKDSKLENQFIEFKMLVQEYHDGILLFAISDEEIWGKAIKDTTGLEKFYEANKQNYLWKKRIEAVIYKCSSDSVAKLIKTFLNKGVERDSIVKMANKNSALNLHFECGKFEVGSNDIINKVAEKIGISKTIKSGSTYYIVDIKNILKPTNKSIDEARGLITADYQNELEKNWIKKLKSDHKVTIHKELLENK